MRYRALLSISLLALLAGSYGPPLIYAADGNPSPTPDATANRKARSADVAFVWLAKHQLPDGRWSLHEYTRRCTDKSCSGQSDISSDAGATALGLLPFLGSGQTHRSEGAYKQCIGKGIDWLISHQQPDGNLAKGSNPMMYGHGLATIALSEAYGLTGDKHVGLAAQRAIDFIVAAQNPRDGGWRYNPRDPGDTCALGWQLAALKSAHMAGLNTNGTVFRDAAKFLDSVAIRGGTEYGYQPDGAGSPATTAIGLLGRQYLGVKLDSPMLIGGAKYLMQHVPEEKAGNIYYWYFGTQVMHNMGGDDWLSWNRTTRDILVRTQVRDANLCAYGSWNPAQDAWGRQGGRLMTTSLAILTLEVYYRYLPLFKTDADMVAVSHDTAIANLAKNLEALRQAVLDEDHAKTAELTCPRVVEAMGGREKFAKRLTEIAGEMRKGGFRITAVKVSKPLDYKESWGQLYSVIPQDMEMTTSKGDKINKHSYLIGMSFDHGVTWTFLDGAGVGSDRTKLEAILPHFPKDLKLPQSAE